MYKQTACTVLDLTDIIGIIHGKMLTGMVRMTSFAWRVNQYRLTNDT